jgi:uncharacterized protein (TIGR04255 family)
MGAFWHAYLRDSYPLTQDQPGAPPIVESFDAEPSRPTVTFELGGPIGRQWYLSQDQTRLVQLQNDFLVVNWRRLEFDLYPRYKTLRVEFERVASLWSAFRRERELPSLPVIQGEVTYINQVPVAEPLKNLSDIGTLLAPIGVKWPNKIGKPETLQLEQRFIVDGPGGKPSRIYIAVAPGIFADGKPYLSLNLTIRGVPAAPSMDAALAWMDFGHNQIINTFADITTDGMRQSWGQRNGG